MGAVRSSETRRSPLRAERAVQREPRQADRFGLLRERRRSEAPGPGRRAGGSVAGSQKRGHAAAEEPAGQGRGGRPGRRPGTRYGRQGRRACPAHVDEALAAPVPTRCPDCGGAVDVTGAATQYQEDLPPVRPLVRRFDIELGHCSQCRRRVQGRHALQHLLRRCEHLLEDHPHCGWAAQVQDTLQAGLALRDRRNAGSLSAHGLATARGRLLARLSRLIDKPPPLDDAERFAAHLATEFPAIFTFLWDPSVDATNWRAEQAIRPAVIRKVCGGNRTRKGADTQQILASVVRTARQRNLDLPALFATTGRKARERE